MQAREVELWTILGLDKINISQYKKELQTHSPLSLQYVTKATTGAEKGLLLQIPVL